MNTIERAFELAPACGSIGELRRALEEDGCALVDVHLGGLGIGRELRRLYNQGAGMKKPGPKCAAAGGAAPAKLSLPQLLASE